MPNVQPGEDRIEINLSTEERTLILEESVYLEDDIRSKLVFGLQRGNQLAYRMAAEDLLRLLAGMAAELETARNRKTRLAFEKLLERLAVILQPILEPAVEKAARKAHPVNALMAEKAEQYMLEHPGASLDELNDFMQAEVARHNQAPIEELHGLSPLQLGCLFQCPEQCVGLNEDIPEEKLKDVEVVRNARIFLRLVAEEKVKATGTGNLNRKIVKKLFEALYPEEIEHFACCVTGKLNEMDLWSIHALRVLLEESRLLRKYRGEFRLTKKGEKALEEGQAGKLYAHLFRTMFHELDLGYMGRGPDWPAFQPTVFYSIAILGMIGREWTDEVDLGERAVFPMAMEELPLREELPQRAIYAARVYLFDRLESFGLIEVHPDLQCEREHTTTRSLRVTPLYDLLFRFNYSEDDLRAAATSSPD